MVKSGEDTGRAYDMEFRTMLETSEYYYLASSRKVSLLVEDNGAVVYTVRKSIIVSGQCSVCFSGALTIDGRHWYLVSKKKRTVEKTCDR